MQIIRDIASLPPECQGSVVALGNFDGMHLGHQRIMDECIHTARTLGTRASVMTFCPHPREYFARKHNTIAPPLRISSLARKLSAMKACGIDQVFLLRFNQSLAQQSAEIFIRDTLQGALKIRHIITGNDFAFGKDRGGSPELLKQLSNAHNFGYSAVAPVTLGNTIVSSSAIRTALGQGDVARAGQLLGSPYHIQGRVCHGQKRGSGLGFPTANITLHNLHLPRFGVYAVHLYTDTQRFPGVANLGIRPTFGGKSPLLEVHVLDEKLDLYGHKVVVTFDAFIRNEKRFDSPNALRAQIVKDTQQARGLLGVAS